MLWSQGFLTYIQDMTIHGFAVFLGLRAGLQRIIYHGGGVPARFNQLMEHGHSETKVSVGPLCREVAKLPIFAFKAA